MRTLLLASSFVPALLCFVGPVAEASELPPATLSAADWNGIRAAHALSNRAVRAEGVGYAARNEAQQWRTRFDERGFTIDPFSGAWTFGLELERFGFSDSQRATAVRTAMCVDAERIEYDWDGALSEWYVNDSSSLEHGYTVHRRPDGGAGPLSFTLAVRGGLSPRLAADRHGVSFLDESGAVSLTYSGLHAFDADGHELEARFESCAGGLRMCIEEHGARYPLTIDPVAQQGYLKASNTGNDDGFGYAVSVSGDTVVVGAWEEDSNATGVNGNQADNSATNAGAAYVFVRTGSTWTQQAYLKASNTELGDEFGFPLAISGDTIVCAARFESSNATGVNGNQADNSASSAGAAYVFVRNGTTWTQQAYLKASNTEASDFFGSSVAVSGDTIVISATSERSNATGIDGNQSDNSLVAAGAAYVFVRNGTTWTQQAYLKASNTESIDQFGYWLSISGDTIAVAAIGEDSNGVPADNSVPDSGAVYVFTRNGTTWAQQAYLKASNPGVADAFGSGVSVSGNTILVGAHYEDSNATGVNGNQANEAGGDSGAAYVFVRSGTVWTQQAYLKASNTGLADEFGASVAVSGDLALVGAVGEQSNATGINGNQANNSLFAAGAAYLFTRSGTTWSQHAYLKASNTGNDDAFGFWVALDGNTLVISAYREDSNATGVGGDGTNNAGPNSGAAYTFLATGLGGPTSFCVGDGTATFCPCSPTPVPHGAAGNGCPNDVNPNGANLAVTGVASLTADTLVLQGTGMNNGACVYIQGDLQQNGGLGTVFGDGLSCVAGTVVRFPIKINSGGASQYPALGDTAISVAGSIGGPGARYYQGWYRSAAPGFCPAATFNLTNGLTVQWAP